MEEAEEINPPIREPSPLTDKVEEADNGPLTLKAAVTVEEPTATKPEFKVANPPAWKVEEAFRAWLTSKLEAMVEEAEDIKPETKDKVPLALNRETSVSKPFCRIEKTKAP